MDDPQCRRVVENLREIFRQLGLDPLQYPDDLIATPIGARHHCAWMVEQMEAFLDEGRREKFMRWLGFIQGVRFALGETTIEAEKDRNRGPKPSA